MECESKTSNTFPESNGRKVPKWAAFEELERDRSRVRGVTHKDRVKSITQKLSKLQQGLEVDKNKSRSAFDKRLKGLEAIIKKSEEEQEQRLEECDQQIEHLMEALSQERLARELLDERKTKEGEVVLKSIDLKLEQLKTEQAKSFNGQAEEVQKLREQLECERAIREQAEEKFGVKLSEQVSKLTEQVEAYQEQNKALINRILQLESNAQESKQTITAERKARGELEGHVVNMLEDLCAKMRTEIVEERNDREAMEETLLKLIEETCSRVEGGLVSPR